MKRQITTIIALSFCALFLALGSLWLDVVGLQTDEALFSAGIYPPFAREYTVKLFGHVVPLMIMNYVGATKGWLYAPLLAILPGSVFLVRFVPLAIGATTVFLFYCLVRKILGAGGAIVATALLATDPLFLLTTRWDWGPSTIQHFCLVGSCLALLKYYENKALKDLICGFALLGIGLWDKALFAGSMAGLAAAALVVLRKQIFAVAKFKMVMVAFPALLLGCLPLIIFNIRQKLVTFTSNAVWSSEDIAGKGRLAIATMEGSAMQGLVTRESWQGPVRQPTTTAERILVDLNGRAGEPKKTLQWDAFLVALAMFPLLPSRHRRVMLFALIFLAVAWSAMAFNKGTGGSVHHTILLWPMPQLVIACVVGLIERWPSLISRTAIFSIVSTIAVANLLVTSTYYARQISYGSTLEWTDAIYDLSSDLFWRKPEAVYLLDWGFVNNLRLLHEGRLNLRIFREPTTANQQALARADLRNANILYITHTEGNRLFDDTQRFLTFAKREGYRKQDVRIFCDRNGRAVIELFQVLPGRDR